MQDPRVLGIAGWSGSGKTTLLVRIIPLLAARGVRVTTIKHAHHEFDVDTPGKDSWKHRAAGATEVIICSSRRWVQIHELGEGSEPSLHGLLQQVSPCDLVLVEGYKRESHPKLEVFRSEVGKPPLYPDDAQVLAVATDAALSGEHPPLIDLNDAEAVTRGVLAYAQPLHSVLSALAARA